MTRTYKLDELPQIATWVIENSLHKSLLFYGEMGVGKTTLIKEIVHQLGSKDQVSSPTFSIVNEYDAGSFSIYHFDFYRIEDEIEVMDIGFEDYFTHENDWQLMEWPELVSNLLPENATKLCIKINEDNLRIIELRN